MASHESGGSPSDTATPLDVSAAAADAVSSSSSYAGTASASTPACPYSTSTLPDHECARYLDCPEHTLARPVDDDNVITTSADDADIRIDADTNPALDIDAPRETQASASASTDRGATDTDADDDANAALDTDALDTAVPPETEASTGTVQGAAAVTPIVAPSSESPVTMPSVPETLLPVSPRQDSEATFSGDLLGNSTQQEDGQSEQPGQPEQPATATEETQPSVTDPETQNGNVDSAAVSSENASAVLAEVVDGQSQRIQVNSVPTTEPLAQPETTSAASSRPSSSSSRVSQPSRSGPARLMGQELAHRAALEVVAASRQRTPTEFALPSWQPDSEVTQCPICGTAFGFFNRKHHCRKCGRVVCSDCSPHRITIPHAYIVRAPGEMTNAQRSADGLGMAIGGGLRVRLCNPCVPDPNTNPPQSQLQPSLNASRFGSRSVRPGHLRAHSSASESVYHDRERTSRERRTDDRYQTDSQSDLWSQDPARSRSATMNNMHMLQATLPRTSAFLGNLGGGEQRWDQSGPHMRRHLPVYNPNGTRPSPPQDLGPFRIPGSQDFRRIYNESVAGSSSASPPARGFYSFQANNLRPSGSSSRQPNNRPLPRPPQIPEEDECPVCHHELPARTLPDFETLREQHITSCITAHSTYSPLPAVPGQPGLHGTPPPRVVRRTGMFPYVATEKDCAKGDECTICLDEYTPGVKLARLECLCRFHHECIMGWFERHPGRCPVHQHDQFGY